MYDTLEDIDKIETLKLCAIPKDNEMPTLQGAEEASSGDTALDAYVQWQKEAMLCFAELCFHFDLPALTPNHLKIMLAIVKGIAEGSYFYSPCRCWMRYPAEVWKDVQIHEPTCLYFQAQQVVADLKGAA